MNEELGNLLNSEATKIQNEKNVEIEPESSALGVIFTIIASLNLIVGIILIIVESSKYYSSDRDYTFALYLLGSSLFLFAIAICLNLLTKISSRMGRIMRTLEK